MGPRAQYFEIVELSSNGVLGIVFMSFISWCESWIVNLVDSFIKRGAVFSILGLAHSKLRNRLGGGLKSGWGLKSGQASACL